MIKIYIYIYMTNLNNLQRTILLQDLIGKIYVRGSEFIEFESNTDEFDVILFKEFFNSLSFTDKIDVNLKQDIEQYIFDSFTGRDIRSIEDEFYDLIDENSFLDNANNEQIVKDTYKTENEGFSINPQKLRMVVSECVDSLKTINSKESNAFLLQEIDISLYKALISNPQLIKTFNWRFFEKLLADIVESFGYEVELMQGTKDNGVDIIAIKNKDSFGVHKYLIQAKQWSNKVGIEPIQRLIFKTQELQATKSCLVTTSNFTKGALQLGNIYKHILDLKNGEALNTWIKEASIVKSHLNIPHF